VKLLIMGDVHGHIKLFADIVNKTDCDVVLQCGDLGIWSLKDFINWGYVEDKHGHYNVYDTMVPITDVTNSKIVFNKPVYFIIGNHENFDLFDLMYKNGEFDGRYNLNYIPYNKLIQAENYKDTVKVSGLSGCYSYKVYSGGIQNARKKSRQIKVKPETPPDIEEYLNRVMGRDPRGRFKFKEVEALMDQKADILLLHEIPTGVNVSSMLSLKNESGCSVLNQLIEEMQPRFVFCGHWHRWYSSKIGRSEIVVLPDILHGYGILNTDTWEFEKK